jgi:Anti-sigma-28 factor, FlgM
MRKPSLKDLEGQIATGTYVVDPAEVADRMLADFALVRRVGRELNQDDSRVGWLGDQDQPRKRGARPSAPTRRGTRFR